MPVHAVSAEELIRKLHDDLWSTAFFESELSGDDIIEVIKVFCRHRRILKVLLSLCADD